MEAAAGTPSSGVPSRGTGGTSTQGGSSADTATTSTSSDNALPKITVNGANPANVNVGSTYADLGATIPGPLYN
jgi:hypothetical protein